ncbi:hypothetical protein [Actinomadura sp. HBU206391]|uniref:hypothetical protein n=1 Tax=Actinomadura sp. HBU206391 TaxID=2731692 RepID=UPI00164F88FA|nr:hypothetical protein [Actinomadura sp. HBU206391]MBC6461075.1 hypothetical protein [Actinomadura sp. HBU206391]
MRVGERVSTALACAALDRGLSGVLLFDLDPALAPAVARRLAELLAAPGQVTVVGATTTEDDLWTRVRPWPAEWAGFRGAPGPLVGAGRPPGVILVPDLARLGLAAGRAAVTTIGADVAHLERMGRHVTWAPSDRWLATCRRDDIGRVSPHLLDRFAVRVDAAGLRPGAEPMLAEPAPSWRRAVRAGLLPGLSVAAADRVIELISALGVGARRDLSLARIARALAALGGASVVEAQHVDDAAHLIGLSAPTTEEPEPGPRAFEAGPAARGGPPVETEPAVREVGASLAEPEPLPTVTLPAPGMSRDPYPEDRAEPGHEAEPLRAPWRRSADGGPPRGHPIGVQAAREIRDIALTATLLESAKFQALRCPDHFRGPALHPLHVRAADLRSHRRAPRPAHLLVLLLDHTCRQGWDWYGALAPYLQWAYSVRAAVGVVEVGAADAPDELCAQRFSARSLLDPRVREALERSAGQATPLAHGLSLAARLLRHDTQHGDAAVDEALLLVVTDGRGNVPLRASRTRSAPGRVGREGVQDALDVAAEIGRLHRVRSLVMDPGPRPYAHLTTELAQTLGGSVVPGGSGDD